MWVYMLMMPVWRASRGDGSSSSSSIRALEDGRWGRGGWITLALQASRFPPSLSLSLSPQSFPFPGKDEFYYGEGLVLNIHNPGFCLRKVTKQGNNATSARIINIHKQNIRHWVVVTIRWHDVLNIHEADIRHWRITTLRQHELINIHELILHVNTKESWYATKKKKKDNY